MNFTVLVQFAASTEYFKGIFLWLITFYPPVLSQRAGIWLDFPSIAPHNL